MASVQKIISASRIFTDTIDVTGVTPGNSAVASLTEVNSNGIPFIGDATMKVYNVVPLNNRFVVRGEVDWEPAISIRITVIFE
ncbi:MAG: hypothetical protein LH613_03585 [Chamaesiphon sp.]|nr:hypothetical protein [Chamaesiphon sp.]